MLVCSPVLCSLSYHTGNSTLILLLLVLSLILLLNCFGLFLLLFSFSLSHGSIRNSLSTLLEVEIRSAYTLPSLYHFVRLHWVCCQFFLSRNRNENLQEIPDELFYLRRVPTKKDLHASHFSESLKLIQM